MTLMKRLTNAAKDAIHVPMRAVGGPGCCLHEMPINNVQEAYASACQRTQIVKFGLHDRRHSSVINTRRVGVGLLGKIEIFGYKTPWILRRFNFFAVDGLKHVAQQDE